MTPDSSGPPAGCESWRASTSWIEQTAGSQQKLRRGRKAETTAIELPIDNVSAASGKGRSETARCPTDRLPLCRASRGVSSDLTNDQ